MEELSEEYHPCQKGEGAGRNVDPFMKGGLSLSRKKFPIIHISTFFF